MTLALNTNNNPVFVPHATDTIEGLITLNQISGIAGNFTFRPGGTAGNSVFTTWASLMAAVSASDGARIIYFDDTLAPCVIPSGTWNMNGVVWQAYPSQTALITVQEGAIFTKLRQVGFGLTITFSGTTPPVSDFESIPGPYTTNFDAFYLGQGSLITTSGAGPFFRMSQMPDPAVIGLDSSILATGTVPVLAIDSGVIAVISCLTISQVQNNTISSGAGAMNLLVSLSSSAMISLTQPNSLGAFGLVNVCQARWSLNFPQIGPTSFNPQTNEVVRCDTTGGNVVLTLPLASLYPGLSIVTKNQSNDAVNSIVVTPTGADTIDGTAGPVNVTGSRAVAEWTSDGISDWMRI